MAREAARAQASLLRVLCGRVRVRVRVEKPRCEGTAISAGLGAGGNCHEGTARCSGHCSSCFPHQTTSRAMRPRLGQGKGTIQAIGDSKTPSNPHPPITPPLPKHHLPILQFLTGPYCLVVVSPSDDACFGGRSSATPPFLSRPSTELETAGGLRTQAPRLPISWRKTMESVGRAPMRLRLRRGV